MTDEPEPTGEDGWPQVAGLPSGELRITIERVVWRGGTWWRWPAEFLAHFDRQLDGWDLLAARYDEPIPEEPHLSRPRAFRRRSDGAWFELGRGDLVLAEHRWFVEPEFAAAIRRSHRFERRAAAVGSGLTITMIRSAIMGLYQPGSEPPTQAEIAEELDKSEHRVWEVCRPHGGFKLVRAQVVEQTSGLRHVHEDA